MFRMKWAKMWRRLWLRLGTPSWMAEMARQNLTKLGSLAHFSQPQQPSTTILSTLTTILSGMPETLPTMTAEHQADAKAMVHVLAARIRTMLQSPKTGQTETQVMQSAVSYYYDAEHNSGQLLT